MVHPKVLRGCDIDPGAYPALALGMGLERFVFRRTRIEDRRRFYENALGF